MSHPRDEWVDVTCLGSAEPIYILARDGRHTEIAEAKALYLADRIDVDELERRVERALTAGSGSMEAPQPRSAP